MKGLCRALEGHSRASRWVWQAKKFASLRANWSSLQEWAGGGPARWVVVMLQGKGPRWERQRWEGQTWGHSRRFIWAEGSSEWCSPQVPAEHRTRQPPVTPLGSPFNLTGTQLACEVKLNRLAFLVLSSCLHPHRALHYSRPAPPSPLSWVSSQP